MQALGARGARRQTCGRASGRAGVGCSDVRGARGRAAGAGRGARGGRLGGLGAGLGVQLGQVGCLVHLTQFLAWFDSVFS